MQDGRPVSSLTEAEAHSQLAALGKLKGSPTYLQRALRRQVGTMPSILHMPEHYSRLMMDDAGQSKHARVAPHAVGSVSDHAHIVTSHHAGSLRAMSSECTTRLVAWEAAQPCQIRAFALTIGLLAAGWHPDK
jgi:hypothetical protein